MTTTKKTTTKKVAKKSTISKSDYPYLSAEAYKEYLSMFKQQGMSERKIKNELEKVNKRIEAKANQPEVSWLTIKIDWKKSRTWGMVPTASYSVGFANGKTDYVENAATASGAGYDKESSVIADIFNRLCVGMAMKKLRTAAGKKNIPYGVYVYRSYVSFDRGIGTSSFYRITEWLGGKMVSVASTKNANVYEFTFKTRKK